MHRILIEKIRIDGFRGLKDFNRSFRNYGIDRYE